MPFSVFRVILTGSLLIASVGVTCTGYAQTALPARSADFSLSGELTQGGWIIGTAPSGTKSLSLDGDPILIDADGRFFAAFDRDAKGTANLTASLADGSRLNRVLTIIPRAWNIERIGTARQPGAATPEQSADFAKRRAAELELVNAARRIQTNSQGWKQRFIWPALGRLSGRFGSQRIYNGVPGGYHSGNDIATGATGTPYVAPADGVVILAAKSPFSLEGNLLMIDHGMGLNSAFLHSSRLLVKEGDVVKQGQVIGLIGMTGRATGPHLHWSVKWHNSRLDSLLFTGPMK